MGIPLLSCHKCGPWISLARNWTNLGFAVAMVIFSSPQASSSPSRSCFYLAPWEGPRVLEGFSQCSHSVLPAWVLEGSLFMILLFLQAAVEWTDIELMVGAESFLLCWSSLRQPLCTCALGLRFSHSFLSSSQQLNSTLCLWLVLGRRECLVSFLAEADLCLASVQNPGSKKISCVTPETEGLCFCSSLISNGSFPGLWGPGLWGPACCPSFSA